MIEDVDVPALLERLGIRAEKRGRELWACCPFPEHEERTPSWHIRDEPGTDRHGRNNCHGCELGGSAIFLVMQVLDLSGKDAWKWIKSGNSIVQRAPKLRASVAESTTSIVHRFRLPDGVVVSPMDTWPERARRYLEDRGVDEWQRQRWGIGYAPEGFTRGGRMHGRIVLPVYDGRGRLISYTGRAYTRSDRKYLEPREEEGADKAAVLGENLWPTAERRTLLVFEGAFNALAGERATGLPVAALYGSQFLPGHAFRLATFPEVVIASDPDKAGDKLERAVRALGRWVKVRRAIFPDGLDANDVERELGAAELARVLGVKPVDGHRGDVAT